MAERSARRSPGRKLTEAERKVRNEGRQKRGSEVLEEAGQENEDARGSTASASAEEPLSSVREEAPFGIVDETVGDDANVRSARRGKKRSDDEASDQPTRTAADKRGIDMLLTMVEAIAVARVGEVGRFTSAERTMIRDGAANILSRMSPKTVKVMTQWSDPMMLGTGIFMYVMRISAASSGTGGDNGGRHSRPSPPPRTPRPGTPRMDTGPIPRNGVHHIPGVPESPPRVHFVPANSSDGPAGPVPQDGPPDGSGFVDDELADMYKEASHNG